MTAKKSPRKPVKRGPRPAKPFSAAVVVASIRRFADQLVAKQAVPYLLRLLNRAQARTKYPLRLDQGMGSCDLYCDHDGRPYATADFGYLVTEAAVEAGKRTDDTKVLRLRERFPELIEFMRLVIDLGDHYVDDLGPTVPARVEDGSRDPVDDVLFGPIVACRRCEQQVPEDETRPVGRGVVCEACDIKERVRAEGKQT